MPKPDTFAVYDVCARIRSRRFPVRGNAAKAQGGIWFPEGQGKRFRRRGPEVPGPLRGACGTTAGSVHPAGTAVSVPADMDGLQEARDPAAGCGEPGIRGFQAGC